MNSIREALQEYLDLRRSLGFKMHDAGLLLPRFVSFMETRHVEHISTGLALEWAQNPSVQPAEWARRLCFVRGFARHRSATDTRTEIPPVGMLPHRSTRARPYLYTEAEVRRLLDAALELPVAWPSTPLRPRVFHCLIGLLSVTGLRISEALNLELGDVDLEDAVLTIRGAKLGRSRLVPIHPTTCTVLADYLRRRKQFLGRQVSSNVFVRFCRSKRWVSCALTMRTIGRLMTTLNPALARVLKRLHYPLDVILTCVRWYVAYPLSLRHLEEMMAERGISVDHSTVHRWAIKVLPVLEKAFRRQKRAVGRSWRMDETYIKVRGQWKYLYRAVDKEGNTVDFLLRAHRDKAAARRYFEKSIDQNGEPETVTIDKSGANLAALDALNAERETPIKIRQNKYLNNVVEQDHRAIKRRTRPMLGFKNFRCARILLSGIELMHMIAKGQMEDSGIGYTRAEQFYSLAA